MNAQLQAATSEEIREVFLPGFDLIDSHVSIREQ